MKKKNMIVAACAALLFALSIPVFADYDASVIQQVQQALNDAGFNCGTPDGKAGNMTAEAVRAYQEAKGMTVDGQISDELLASLGIGDAEGSGSEELAAAEGTAGEDPAAAEVPEDNAGTNDSNGALVGSSKFDETMYEGTWYTIKCYSDEDDLEELPYEIYVPTDWLEKFTSTEEYIVMPEEFSDFIFGAAILPPLDITDDELEAADLDYLSIMAMSLDIDTGLNKISINGIDDVYYGGMYDESAIVDDAGSVFPKYIDALLITDKEGRNYIIFGRYEGSFDPPVEGQVEKFMLITRNILSSLRIAGTEEEAAS